MADVSDVAHIAHLVSKMAQELAEHVISHTRTGVAKVSVAIDGRSANIHPDVTGIHRLEDLLQVAHSIGESKSPHNIIYIGLRRYKNN